MLGQDTDIYLPRNQCICEQSWECNILRVQARVNTQTHMRSETLMYTVHALSCVWSQGVPVMLQDILKSVRTTQNAQCGSEPCDGRVGWSQDLTWPP